MFLQLHMLEISVSIALCFLPLGSELLRLWPELGVSVQSIDRNHDQHALRDGDSIYLYLFFRNSLQTPDGGVEPVHTSEDRFSWISYLEKLSGLSHRLLVFTAHKVLFICAL